VAGVSQVTPTGGGRSEQVLLAIDTQGLQRSLDEVEGALEIEREHPTAAWRVTMST
jgi:hypothetical protein